METQKFCDKLLYIVLESLLNKTIKFFVAISLLKIHVCFVSNFCKLFQVLLIFSYVTERSERLENLPMHISIAEVGSHLFIYIFKAKLIQKL